MTLRTTALASACLLALSAPAARATEGTRSASDKGRCTFEMGPRDVVAREGDLVVEAGQDVERAVALKGSVVLHAGAKVETAVAVRGSVTVEAGARVTGTAVAVGGKVQVRPGGTVSGKRVSLGDDFDVVDEDGKRVELPFFLDGKAIAREAVKAALEGLDECKVITITRAEQMPRSRD